MSKPFVREVEEKFNDIDTSLNNVYTKTQVDSQFSNVYTKTQVDSTLSNIYTKTEIDNKGYLSATDMVILTNGVKIQSKLYYSNIPNTDIIYVKIGTITINGSYNRAYFKADLYITGASNSHETIEIMTYHNVSYNSISSMTYLSHYNISSKQAFADGDLVYTTTDTGTTYVYDFYIKLTSNSKFYINVLGSYSENATLNLLPVTVVTSATLPTGATNVPSVTIGGGSTPITSSTKIYKRTFTNNIQGVSTFSINIAQYNETTDTLFVKVNGIELYESVDFSKSGNTVTLSNNYTLDANDKIMLVVFTNTI